MKAQVDHYVRTVSGVKFYPFQPRLNDINITDIAHGLSQTSRFGGQTPRYYSVAEHCVRVSEILARQGSESLLGEALLHSASRAYVGDIRRPVKRRLGQYLEIQRIVSSEIEKRFALPRSEESLSLIQRADEFATHVEWFSFFGPAAYEEDFRISPPELLVALAQEWRLGWTPQEAKAAFLRHFTEGTSTKALMSCDPAVYSNQPEYIRTASGRKLYPFSPREEDISVEDITIGLSHTCRYGGQTPRYYSVAEHCVRVCEVLDRFASGSFLFEGLLHDASEAYLGDIQRPIKKWLDEYKEVERIVTSEVERKLGLESSEQATSIVHWADNLVMHAEFVSFFGEETHVEDFGTFPSDRVKALAGEWELGWSPEKARSEFMDHFERLQGSNAS